MVLPGIFIFFSQVFFCFRVFFFFFLLVLFLFSLIFFSLLFFNKKKIYIFVSGLLSAHHKWLSGVHHAFKKNSFPCLSISLQPAASCLHYWPCTTGQWEPNWWLSYQIQPSPSPLQTAHHSLGISRHYRLQMMHQYTCKSCLARGISMASHRR